jgi:SagB-type dehydrogenase family enzyme
VSDTPQNPLRAYHARTKHRFAAYAEGPGQLDWDAQPAPFRHYPGAPVIELPLAAAHFDRPYAELATALASPAKPGLDSLGCLLELSLAIAAWKSWGPNRWALRCNPSSGNLHPVEAWVLAGGLPDVPDGLHHYEAEQHALEGRALTLPCGEAPWLAVALSSVMWREAWKYGERAFRYCQLDVGHAVGALAYAAALLGWAVRPLAVPGETLASLLGLDRAEDFPPSRYAFTENEEPEILLAIEGPGLQPIPALSVLLERLQAATWQGQPTRIDPSPGYRWPVIDQAAAASRRTADAETPLSAPNFPAHPPLPALPGTASAAQLIRQRRSAQRFNPKCSLPQAAFYRILDAVLPRPGLPFSAQEADPRLQLLLFVLRVDGLSSGLYLLPRTPAARELQATLASTFPDRQAVADAPPHLGLLCLAKLDLQEVQRLARALSCHQDIAATSAFSLGMLADFTDCDGYGYRRLLREAGLLGQVLYLEAEAAGVRGTGIGCFFDDPVHQAFGLAGERWQSVYHFTIGTPVDDARIETGPPYPQRQKEQP